MPKPVRDAPPPSPSSHPQPALRAVGTPARAAPECAAPSRSPKLVPPTEALTLRWSQHHPPKMATATGPPAQETAAGSPASTIPAHQTSPSENGNNLSQPCRVPPPAFQTPAGLPGQPEFSGSPKILNTRPFSAACFYSAHHP